MTGAEVKNKEWKTRCNLPRSSPGLRRFPRLSRWIFTQAEVDYAVAGNGLQAFSLGPISKRLADDDDAGRTGGNLVNSPLSVYAALSVVTASQALLDELLAVLGAPSRDALADQSLADQSRTGGPVVSFTCGVWHDRTMPLRLPRRCCPVVPGRHARRRLPP
jgi:serpin B